MGSDDRALVVGITDYPELDNLEGAERDAEAFYAWVTSLDGGGVPADHKHAKLIRSSDYTPRPFANALAAAPTESVIMQFFDGLQDEAQAKADKGEDNRLGRRLYLYFAGHGFAPTFEDSALLMANATRVRVGYHIPGKAWADWFYRAGYFDEMILLMDCCRENYSRAPLNVPRFMDLTSPEPMDRGKRFYVFGTKWARLSRERAMPDGQVRGVFTTALLQGLRNAADANGNVTASGLSSWLYQNMRFFLDPADLESADIAKEPDIFGPNQPGQDFVLVNVPAPNFPVTVTYPPEAKGKKLNIRGAKFEVLDSRITDGTPCNFELPRGGYLAELIGAESQAFEVKGVNPPGGDGATHVGF